MMNKSEKQGALWLRDPLRAAMTAHVTGAPLCALGAVLCAAFYAAALVLCGLALCVFACFVWSVPASAVLTLGLGLVLLALGGLVALLFIKMLRVFVPPVFRCIVGFFGWICRKVRGLFK